MDAFFAAIEQRDNPELRGKPVIIGGDPEKRGVVATCSYEARQFGVRSAMPTRKAHQLCPHGIFIPPRFKAYKEVSLKIREIFLRYTDLVEPLSLDEAFLDVTVNKMGNPSATLLAQEIKREILRETGLTASAGVSFNKFLAKVASDWQKPDGLTVIPPEKAAAFIDQLPVRKIFGVGKVTETKMAALGIRTGKDLKAWTQEDLTRRFGKMGRFFWKIVHCEDDRPVNPSRERKSYGKEVTLEEDIVDIEDVKSVLMRLCEALARLLDEHQAQGRTVTLKVRYEDFTTVTRSCSLKMPDRRREVLLEQALRLLEKTAAGSRKIRLLGVAVSNLS